MKIALVTIHNANNYGAIFQTFATQQVLLRYGEVDIVNYDNRHVSRSYDLIRLKPSFHGLLGTGKDILRLFPRYRVIRKFKKFIKENLSQTRAYSQQEILAGKVAAYDVYVAGSDQIWNPSCASPRNEIDPVYFLDFAPENSKKFSYASSAGGYNYSEMERQQVKGFLRRFDAISVREKSTQLLLQDLLGSSVDHVLDPTLLLSKKEWLNMAKLPENYTSDQKYILLYTVPKVPLVRRAVQFFSRKIGLPVISVDQGISAGAKVDKHIRDASPEDFLRLFAGAQFVITDSFHGVCFSINFGIPFVAISPGIHSGRIESLLSLLRLDKRLLKNETDFANVEGILDFAEASDLLSIERNKSISFLSGIIGRC